MNRTRNRIGWMLVAFAGLLVFGLQSARAGDEAPKKRVVAVGDFENRAPVSNSEVASFVDMITTALVKTRKFDVLERNRLHELLKEQSLGEFGLTDPKNAQKFGKLSGADFILLGTLTEAMVDSKTVGAAGFGAGRSVARLSVDIRIIDGETGSIKIAETVTKEVHGSVGMSVPQVSFSSDTAGIFGKAARQCADEVVRLTAQTIFPVRIIAVNGDEVMLNYGAGSLESGDVYDVFSLGEEVKDPDTGEVLGQSEKKVGRIVISSVEARFSKGRIESGGDAIKKDMLCRKSDSKHGDDADKDRAKRKHKLHW